MQKASHQSAGGPPAPAAAAAAIAAAAAFFSAAAFRRRLGGMARSGGEGVESGSGARGRIRWTGPAWIGRPRHGRGGVGAEEEAAGARRRGHTRGWVQGMEWRAGAGARVPVLWVVETRSSGERWEEGGRRSTTTTQSCCCATVGDGVELYFYTYGMDFSYYATSK
jgi:hypothetical protein